MLQGKNVIKLQKKTFNGSSLNQKQKQKRERENVHQSAVVEVLNQSHLKSTRRKKRLKINEEQLSQ